MDSSLKELVDKVWDDRILLNDSLYSDAIRETIDLLDKGKIRISEKKGDKWVLNEWVKKAVILYFPLQQMQTIELNPFEYHDKIPLKNNYEKLNVRVVPWSYCPIWFIYRRGSYNDAFICEYRSLC